MTGNSPEQSTRRILGRVERSEFVGRTAELQQIVSHPSQPGLARGLLVLLAPSAGVSELLRQAYDELFNLRGEVVPIYFALTRNEITAVSVAIEFLNTFLQQYVANRRAEPELCKASLTLNDLVQLALPPDLEWIEQLVEAYNRERFSNDDKAFVRFCLSAPQRVPPRNGHAFVMIDGVQLAERCDGQVLLGIEIVNAVARSGLPFALAGLRRQILDLFHRTGCSSESIDILRLEKLGDEDARRLVERAARRQQVAITEETRDLLVQQFECSPFFITAILQAARERNASLTNYLGCERLYVDELMGGRIQRHFASLMEEIAPKAETRRSLARILHETAVGQNHKASFETWRKRLQLEAEELESILRGLHAQEFVNWDAGSVEVVGGPSPWKDYLTFRFRLDIAGDSRALVVADTMGDALKRAPGTMARFYKRGATLGLRELLGAFDCQRVPQILFQYDKFSEKYKGITIEEALSDLEAETNLIKLPQVIHTATCSAFSDGMREICEEDRCTVAHAFDGAHYTDANAIVWLVAELESKLEADGQLTDVWCGRLEALARKLGFGRFRIWLIANEGFTSGASEVLNKRNAYGSSRRQLELLSGRLNENQSLLQQGSGADEFVLILPMGGDNELIAANAVEQIARRIPFRPEAINQIKTAIVEACINAAEHSFSPDRKIYQRFRVENDRLVVTISSRGVVPANLGDQNGEQGASLDGVDDAAKERRGWGLKLIKTLMDEVEFERVDDGTSLRMTKYLRNSSS